MKLLFVFILSFETQYKKYDYSERRLMESQIMGSIGYWDQIYPV